MIRKSIFVLACACLLSVYAQDKPSLIVRPLTGDTAQILGWQPALGEGLAEMLVTRLTESEKFDVLESTGMDTLIAEKQLADAGYVEDGEAGKKSSFAAADYMFSGKVTRFGSKKQGANLGGFVPQSGGKLGIGITTSDVQIDWRITDAATRRVIKAGKAVANERGTSFDVGVAVDGSGGNIGFDNKEFMNSALGKATVKALDIVMVDVAKVNLPKSGRRQNIQKETAAQEEQVKEVVRQEQQREVEVKKELAGAMGQVLAVVDQRTVIVSLGSRNGVQPGSRLELFGPSEPIKAENGEIAWEEDQATPVGELEVLAVQGDRCKTKYSGNQEIKAGWRARVKSGK